MTGSGGLRRTTERSRILIGYSMRSGSTLLQHMLAGHSHLRGTGDLTSWATLPATLLGLWPGRRLCVKPMDLLYLQRMVDYRRRFDHFIWLARDPRDSYLSSIESGYAYLAWPRGRREAGIDVGLLKRWRRIHEHLFENPARWLLVRYEDLVANPRRELVRVLDHLGLPPEDLTRFGQLSRVHGGDRKIRATTRPHTASVGRHARELEPEQQAVFTKHLGPEMQRLGYIPWPWPVRQTKPAAASLPGRRSRPRPASVPGPGL